MTPETTDPHLECAFGHTQRNVGCVSCVLVFDRAIPGLPIGVQETTDPRITEIRAREQQRKKGPWRSDVQVLLDAIASLQQRVEEEQRAAISIAATLLTAGFSGDGNIDGVKWLAQRVEVLTQEQAKSSQIHIAALESEQSWQATAREQELRAESAEQRLEAAERERDDVRRLSLNYIEQTNALMESLRSAIDGQELSDFMLSFALVGQVDAQRQAKEAAEATIVRLPAALRSMLTNEFIRAIGALARQQDVCRVKDGAATFVTGMEAAREYIVEHVEEVLASLPSPPVSAPDDEDMP